MKLLNYSPQNDYYLRTSTPHKIYNSTNQQDL